MTKYRHTIRFYAGLTRENFYYACTPLSQKATGLNMKVFVSPSFIQDLKPRIWVQNNHNVYSDGNLIPVDIETQTLSKYYRKRVLNITKKDFEQLKQFILLNQQLLISIWEQKPPYSSDEILKNIKIRNKVVGR